MSQDHSIDIDKMNSMEWYHRIDLGDGIVTPGLTHPGFQKLWNHISTFLDGVDFHGKSVLDIGCWDGKWSFEAERRGASLVVATDDISQRTYGSEQQFKFAQTALDSQTIYHPHVSVYDIDQVSEGPFDIILFMGVLYHLRYPFYALAKIRHMLKEGGILVIETACMNDSSRSYMETQLGLNYTIYPDPTTWCAPSILCLREMLESSYFDVKRDVFMPHDDPPSASSGLENNVSSRLKQAVRALLGRSTSAPAPLPAPSVGRMLVESRAVLRSDDKHPVPDPLLCQFDYRFRK